MAGSLQDSQVAGLKPHQLSTRHMHNMCLTTVLYSCMTWHIPRASLVICLLQALNVCLKWTAPCAWFRSSTSTLFMCFRAEKELEKQRAKALKESQKKEKEASAAWQQLGPVHAACRFTLAVAMLLPMAASGLCLQMRKTCICYAAADCNTCQRGILQLLPKLHPDHVCVAQSLADCLHAPHMGMLRPHRASTTNLPAAAEVYNLLL